MYTDTPVGKDNNKIINGMSWYESIAVVQGARYEGIDFGITRSYEGMSGYEEL